MWSETMSRNLFETVSRSPCGALSRISCGSARICCWTESRSLCDNMYFLYHFVDLCKNYWGNFLSVALGAICEKYLVPRFCVPSLCLHSCWPFYFLQLQRWFYVLCQLIRILRCYLSLNFGSRLKSLPVYNFPSAWICPWTIPMWYKGCLQMAWYPRLVWEWWRKYLATIYDNVCMYAHLINCKEKENKKYKRFFQWWKIRLWLILLGRNNDSR